MLRFIIGSAVKLIKIHEGGCCKPALLSHQVQFITFSLHFEFWTRANVCRNLPFLLSQMQLFILVEAS